MWKEQGESGVVGAPKETTPPKMKHLIINKLCVWILGGNSFAQTSAAFRGLGGDTAKSSGFWGMET